MQFLWKTAEAGRTPESIAAKHGVPVEQMRAEIEKGVGIEKEHSDLLGLFKRFLAKNKLEMPLSDDEFFRMISMAHVDEVKDYYQKLEKHVEPSRN